MKKPVAIVPAAGVGTRLRPHTHTVPKALINVAGRPILAHILDGLIAEGVERIVLIIGYMGDSIRAYAEKRYGDTVVFVEQEERLGLGHAVSLAESAVVDGPILIVLGDTIVHTDLRAFLSGPDIVLGVQGVPDPERFGIVELDGDRVIGLAEKPERPKSNLALVGLYYIPESRGLFEALRFNISNKITRKGEYQLTDALASLLDQKMTMRARSVEGWFDCGKTETLLSTNRYLLDLLPESPIIPGVVVIHPVSCDPTARIEHSIIGPYVSIAGGATVKGAILRDSIVNENAEIYNLLLDSSVVGENAIVRGSFQVLNVGDSSEISLAGAPGSA